MGKSKKVSEQSRRNYTVENSVPQIAIQHLNSKNSIRLSHKSHVRFSPRKLAMFLHKNVIALKLFHYIIFFYINFFVKTNYVCSDFMKCSGVVAGIEFHINCI